MSAPAIDHLLKSIAPGPPVSLGQQARTQIERPFESYLQKATEANASGTTPPSPEPSERSVQNHLTSDEVDQEAPGEDTDRPRDPDVEETQEAVEVEVADASDTSEPIADEVVVSTSAQKHVDAEEESEADADESVSSNEQRIVSTQGESSNDQEQPVEASTEEVQAHDSQKKSSEKSAEQVEMNGNDDLEQRGNASGEPMEPEALAGNVAALHESSKAHNESDEESPDTTSGRMSSAELRRGRLVSRNEAENPRPPFQSVTQPAEVGSGEQTVATAPRITVEALTPTNPQPLQLGSSQVSGELRANESSQQTSATTNRTVDTEAMATGDRVRFVQRVASAFRQAQQNEGHLQLRLSPPELGSLRIEIAVRNGVLTANLETETSEARRILLDNLPALRDRLAQQEIRVERFDVDVRRDGHQQQTQHQETGSDQREPSREEFDAGSMTQSETNSESTASLPIQHDTISEGFDVRI